MKSKRKYFVKIIKIIVRDCQQITFVMLNGFCQLSESPPPYPCSLRTMAKWIEYQPKLNERYIPFLQCISSFEGTSYKNL